MVVRTRMTERWGWLNALGAMRGPMDVEFRGAYMAVVDRMQEEWAVFEDAAKKMKEEGEREEESS